MIKYLTKIWLDRFFVRFVDRKFFVDFFFWQNVDKVEESMNLSTKIPTLISIFYNLIRKFIKRLTLLGQFCNVIIIIVCLRTLISVKVSKTCLKIKSLGIMINSNLRNLTLSTVTILNINHPLNRHQSLQKNKRAYGWL